MQQHDDARSDHTHRADILIVGAGMAGLTAATALQATGYSVRVIDKGRTVGGVWPAAGSEQPPSITGRSS